MGLVGSPSSLTEIQAALTRVDAEVSRYFASIPAGVFFAHPPQVWSPAENVAHLVKSIRPVVLALRVPRRLSGLIWGAPASSRTFAELVAFYKAALAAGGTAPAQFVPELAEPTGDLDAAKATILADWQRTAAKLEAALANWKDEDLDKANLPHPLLGKLTVREVLFFTLYHNLHHVNDVHRLLAEPEVEV
jgi:hypothetical protein